MRGRGGAASEGSGREVGRRKGRRLLLLFLPHLHFPLHCLDTLPATLLLDSLSATLTITLLATPTLPATQGRRYSQKSSIVAQRSRRLPPKASSGLSQLYRGSICLSSGGCRRIDPLTAAAAQHTRQGEEGRKGVVYGKEVLGENGI